MGYLEWEDRELLKRVVEALESVAASLVRMNKLTEVYRDERNINSIRDMTVDVNKRSRSRYNK